MTKTTCLIPMCDEPEFGRGWCIKHYTRWLRHGDPNVTLRPPSVEPAATEKWCPRCSAMKPLTDFRQRKNKSGERGLTGYCIPCMAAYDADYRATEDGRAKKRRASLNHSSGSPRHDQGLQKRYGITLDDYEAMLERQGGRCAICGTDQPTKHDKRVKRWTVDHCHITGRVRGLLCNICNLGIGKFDDDPHLLRIAVAYLEATSAHRLPP